MNEITPFQFEDHAVRVQVDEIGQPWFNAADVCDALEMGNPSQAIKSHVDSDDLQKLEVIDNLGRTQRANHVNESGLYALILGSTKDAAKRFKRWVTSEVLPSIRKTGGYQSKPSKLPSEAFRLLPMVVRAARALGLDKNAAAISANQAVAKMTGTNVMRLLGATHLEAENQELVFTPTELGAQMGGISARRVNMLLAEAGLQARKGDQWAPLPPAGGLFRVLDTGKRRSDGAMVQQIKWSADVLGLVQQQGAEGFAA